MKLPEPSPQEVIDHMMRNQPVHRTSTDTAITTPGAIATVVIAGVVFNAITPLWLLLAVPLALISWGTEAKWWMKK